MPSRRSTSVFFSILLLLFVYPAGAEIIDHFQIGSIETEILDSALVESGIVPPFFSRPFTGYQYLKEVRRLDTSRRRLPEYPEQVMGEIESRLIEQKSKEAFIRPLMDTSLRLQKLSHEPSGFDRYLYYRKSVEAGPLLGLGFIGGTPYILGTMYFDLRRDFFSSHEPDQYTNLPTGEIAVQEFDYNFPTRGYIAAGNEYVDVLMGRDRLRWGPGYRGSLVLSDSPPYYDMINASFHLSGFKYSIAYISLESYMTDEEYNLQVERSNTGAIGFPKQNTDQYKTLAGHRIEFRLFRRINIGLTELIVVGGRVPEWSELTPMMFFHNIYGENYSNDSIGFDIAVVPYRKIMLYGEWLIEDARHQWESDISPPTSFGWMAGGLFTHSFGFGILSARLEWARTDPWVYNRWQPYSMFTARKKFLSPASEGYQVLDFPTGYFLGPDADSLFLQAELLRYGMGRVKLSYELRRKGRIYLDPLDPESDFVVHLNDDLVTPTGTAVISHIVGLGGEFTILPWLFCSLDIFTGYRKNDHHIPGNNHPFFEGTLNLTASPLNRLSITRQSD